MLRTILLNWKKVAMLIARRLRAYSYSKHSVILSARASRRERKVMFLSSFHTQGSRGVENWSTNPLDFRPGNSRDSSDLAELCGKFLLHRNFGRRFVVRCPPRSYLAFLRRGLRRGKFVHRVSDLASLVFSFVERVNSRIYARERVIPREVEIEFATFRF